MNLHHSRHFVSFVAALFVFSFAAKAGEKDVVVEKNFKTPPPTDPERWKIRLSLPAWMASVEGTTGLHGSNSDVALGFGELVNKIDMVAALRFEARKGRFGFYGDFSYMSLSDGTGGEGLVKKLTFRQDQYLGDLGLSWRVMGGERGWLEIIGGVRYVNLFEEVEIQSNDQRVEAVSTRLAVAGAVARAVLLRELAQLSGRNPKLPIAPLSGGQRERVIAAVERIGNNQERIERRLKQDLNRRFARSDDWFDPYVGVRGQYQLNGKYYVLGRADIGGFGVGSDLSWQASAGFGCHLSERLYTEVVYRALSMDYDKDGFVYDMVTHGPEISLGLAF
jgi:hypothetical protein